LKPDFPKAKESILYKLKSKEISISMTYYIFTIFSFPGDALLVVVFELVFIKEVMGFCHSGVSLG